MNSATSVFSSPGPWFLFRLLMRRLHLIRDVEHAHSPGIDVAISDYRDLSGCGLRLDVLGNRAEDVQAASDTQAIPQERSRRIGDLDSVVRYRVLRAMLWRLPSPAIIRNFPKNCDY
ncbi:hypothetical protein V1294_005535 [Bradyrhizobium sp. AZCC 1678]|uniref:hypothetical protein n=1 Tax=Bradyrhizobium sp. AZCC 1678 TaxID=3117030 RepID=UPI002FF25970